MRYKMLSTSAIVLQSLKISSNFFLSPVEPSFGFLTQASLPPIQWRNSFSGGA